MASRKPASNAKTTPRKRDGGGRRKAVHGKRGANNELQFQVLIDAVKNYAIYMLDPKGYVSTWNSGAEQAKGYTADEIIGRSFECFYTEEDRAAGVPKRVLATAAKEGKFDDDGWRVRKDGTRFYAHAHIERINDPTGKLIGFAKVTRDVTEERESAAFMEQARERLAQAQKMEAVGQLTGGIAHDFNNLLMVIIGNLELIEKGLNTPKPGTEANMRRQVANALSGARRGATLTARLLAFARRQALKPAILDVNKFIGAEVEFLQRSLGEAVQIEAIGAGGLWPVEVDANQLEAALLNLAVNARDAMSSGGGKLTIEANNVFLDRDYARANPEVIPGQYVMISVSDTGAGMDRQTLERAFEPFFTTKETGVGSGLGLSQVYGFVKQSGGHIKIYSEPGEGTAVKIYLPRAANNREEETRPPSEREAVGAGEVVLVVEDDDDVRQYLVGILGDMGYRVEEAADGETALKRIGREPDVDLLLTDVVMPVMNGRELMRRAHEIRPGLNVLFMTGYSRNAIVHQGRLDPGVELVQKPVSQAELASRVRDVLDAAPPVRKK